MAVETILDEMVEEEIRRLQNSPYVKLANYEKQVRNRRRKYLNSLRYLEKRGKDLEAQGITREKLAQLSVDELAGEAFGECF